MKKQTLDLQTLTMISLFAALIFLSIQFFKIPVGAKKYSCDSSSSSFGENCAQYFQVHSDRNTAWRE